MNATQEKQLLQWARKFELPNGLVVERRYQGLWCINGGRGTGIDVLWSEKDQKWYYQPLPSNRTDKFNHRTRYGLEQAITIAEKLDPDKVHGSYIWVENEHAEGLGKCMVGQDP